MPTFIWHNGSAWFYPRFMSYLVSCSYSPEQCWTWYPSHGVGLKPYQILVSYSHKLCATVATANLACKSPLETEGLYSWICIYLSPLAAHRGPHLPQKQVSRYSSSLYSLSCFCWLKQ